MIVIEVELDDLFASMSEQLNQHDTKAITPLPLVQLVSRLRPKDAYDIDEIGHYRPVDVFFLTKNFLRLSEDLHQHL